MAKPPGGATWFLDDPAWNEWLAAFPTYDLRIDSDFSAWRRSVELAANRPLPTAPLPVADKAAILAALTLLADRLQANAAASSGTTVTLAGAAAITAIGALLFHPLVIVAGILAAAAGAKSVWDTGYGSNAGNKAVHDLLIRIAGTLP